MNLIDINGLPTANKNIYDIIVDMYDGNISRFAKVLGLDNSTKINRLFQKDKRNGKYPVPSTDLLIKIREHFSIPVDEILFSREKRVQNKEEVAKTIINIIKGDHNKNDIKQ